MCVFNFSEQSLKPSLLPTAQQQKNSMQTSDESLDQKPRQRAFDLPLIRSPEPIKPKRICNKNLECHSTHLLHQVDRIDAKDVNNPQMLSEYVNDIYNYLFKLETIFPINTNFLQNHTDVTPKMRSVLLDWINEVHHQFGLEIETYYMAVSMIDRYLQSERNVSRKYLQLVGVTALFMASKYEELMPPEITDFVYVTDDTYTKEQILAMEIKIFQKLGYNLSKPLPIHFFRRFAKAAGTLGDRQYISGKYFMELASIDYELTKYHPSEVTFKLLKIEILIFIGCFGLFLIDCSCITLFGIIHLQFNEK
jgi:G2/mitotic-specific cyclin-B2